jgi:ribosomal protein L37AE/L43A
MAIPNYQDIMALLKKGLTMEAQEKIMELREAALEYQNENLTLKTNIKELKDALALRDSLQWQKPYYVKKENPSEKFCQRCYDADGKAIRLQELETGYWRCMECETDYTDGNYQDPVTDPEVSGRNRTTGY